MPSTGSSGSTSIWISLSDNSLHESQLDMTATRVGTRRTGELGGVDRFEDLRGWVRQLGIRVLSHGTSNSSASTSADMDEGLGCVEDH